MKCERRGGSGEELWQPASAVLGAGEEMSRHAAYPYHLYG